MRFLMLFLLTCLAGAAWAQSPLLRNVEVGYATATFDPFRGVSLQANHAWRDDGRRAFQTGISLTGMLRPGSSPATSGTVEETFSTVRLQLHSGWERAWGEKARWYGQLEGFVGLRSYVISGRLDQAAQDFDRRFSAATFRGDLGLRLGLGYRLGDHWGLQLTSTSSLLEVDNPLGPWVGLFFWAPDVLSILGLGAQYRF